MTEPSKIADVDTDRPNAARMYDYFLGGSLNFAADRQAAERVLQAIPNIREIAAANRTFLRRAVLHMIDLGVRQFLDIGSGLPTVGNVHEIAQAADPAARVVYVDIDPVAVAYSLRLLEHNKQATAIDADLRNAQAILAHPQLREALDLAAPVGLLLTSVLHFVADDADAYPAVAELRNALVPGSCIAISHATDVIAPDRAAATEVIYRRTISKGGTVRTRDQIAEFFGDYTVLEPGLVWVSQWQPGSLAQAGAHPEQFALLAGVARKPGGPGE
jgi:S-adenosyl methyltransferase